MSVRWVRNRTTGLVFDVREDHWSLADDQYEHIPTPPDYDPPAPAALPDDFPALDVLSAYGFTTRGSLSGMTIEKLTALKGIGPARARSILDARDGA